MKQTEERIESEWGFWYDAEEGPEFWHGPWEGSPLAMWSTLALYVGALLLSMGLMPRRHRHGLRRRTRPRR